jgi:hypothetical protein
MFKAEKFIPWEVVEKEVRNTTLLATDNLEVPVYPYENAAISLREVNYDEVRPTSLYVLKDSLAIQAALGSDLIFQGYHPLHLEGGLVLRNDGGEQIGFVPPIVEETKQEGMYVLDGAHRTSIGRWLGRTSFVAIHIADIREDCPAYAYPNNWDDIRIFNTTPSDAAQKKHYRGENYRRLYRDFSQLNGSCLRENVGVKK